MPVTRSQGSWQPPTRNPTVVGLVLVGILLAWSDRGLPATSQVEPAPSPPPQSPATSLDAEPPLDPVGTGLVDPVAPGPAVLGLRDELGRVLDGTGWSSSRWSVLAVSLDRGDTLFTRDPDLPLAPASNAKILTSGAALHYLGADFRFQTFVLASGTLDDGILEGDLVLYGTGDPTISDRLFPSKTAVLDSLARTVASLGVRRVRGAVVGDGSFFRDALLPETWPDEDLNDWFAAPVSALSFNENVVTLRIEPGPYPGASPIVHTIPEGLPVEVRNVATTVAGRAWPPIMLDRSHPSAPLGLVGELPLRGREVWRVVTMDDPARFAAFAFRDALERAGVAADTARGLDPGEASLPPDARLSAPGLLAGSAPRVLAVHRSPPLSDLLEVLNKESHNLYAETLLKTMGQVVLGDPTLQGGAEAVRRYLVSVVGASPASFRIQDGSGLSPENRVSASTLVRVMAHLTDTPHGRSFWASLPEAGNYRELRRMYRGAAARNLRAKTGTIEGVSALSGTVRTADGERVLFSILSNNLPSSSWAKRIEDRIGLRLAGFSRHQEPLRRGP